MEEEKSNLGSESKLSNQADTKSNSSEKILTIDQLQLGENGRKEDLAYYTIMLSNLVSMRREIDSSINIFSRELKSKIEQTMNLKPTTILISKLLSQILSDAVTFDEKHSKLINLLIDTLKEFGKPETPEFRSDNEAIVLRELIIDFLLRIKDKHPFSDLVEGKIMDVLNSNLEFLFGYSFKPSVALLKEYSESKITRDLNTLPSLEYLNSKFNKDHPMNEGDYEKLKERFKSRPPFVFYFNPDIQVQEKVFDDFVLRIGFFDADDKQIGAGIKMNKDGAMYQGYFKDNRCHIYGRFIWNIGEIYEG